MISHNAVMSDSEDTVTGVNSPEAVGSAAIAVSCNSPDSHAKEETPEIEREDHLDENEQDNVDECEEGGMTESAEALKTTAHELAHEVGCKNLCHKSCTGRT